jgi:hypothetical protein
MYLYKKFVILLASLFFLYYSRVIWKFSKSKIESNEAKQSSSRVEENYNCFEKIFKIAEALDDMSIYGNETPEYAELGRKIIMGLCADGKVAKDKEQFLENFKKY